MLGERFGSFKAIAKIGDGGMGEVYLAEHQRIERRAAIKVLAPERTRDAEAVRRFFAEARATSLIRHPGIVEVYDCDVHRNGRAYIVMEYLDGENVGKRLDRRGGALAWPAACLIARHVADAIGAAHEQRIIHRDLKPENVFLLSPGDRPRQGEVKVLDFGLAKLLTGALVVGAITKEGSLLGSPGYMSPEQCEGQPADARADVYSLGCMLFEMITGRPPFPGRRLRQLLAAHRFHAPPALSGLAPEVPAWLDGLVARMLSKAPIDRPQTMADTAAALAPAELVESGDGDSATALRPYATSATQTSAS
jgi:serine/threonine-protein kinase